MGFLFLLSFDAFSFVLFLARCCLSIGVRRRNFSSGTIRLGFFGSHLRMDPARLPFLQIIPRVVSILLIRRNGKGATCVLLPCQQVDSALPPRRAGGPATSRLYPSEKLKVRVFLCDFFFVLGVFDNTHLDRIESIVVLR